MEHNNSAYSGLVSAIVRRVSCAFLCVALLLPFSRSSAQEKELPTGLVIFKGYATEGVINPFISVTLPSDPMGQAYIPYSGSPTNVNLKLGKEYLLELRGGYTPGSSPLSAGAAIGVTAETCYELVVVDASSEDEAGMRRLFDEYGGSTNEWIKIKLIKPAKDKDHDLGQGGAAPDTCQCDHGGPGGGSNGGGGEIGFEFSASMGRNGAGLPVGRLEFDYDFSSSLLDVNGVKFSATMGGAEQVFIGGVLRQVKSTSGLADITQNVDGSIQIVFYVATNVGEKVGGVYAIVNGDQPSNPVVPSVVKYVFAPASDTAFGNGVVYTVSRDNAEFVESYFGSNGSAGNVGKRIDSSGVCTETHSVVQVDPMDSSQWKRIVEEYSYLEENGVEIEIERTRREYKSKPWGEVLQQTIAGNNSLNLVTTYAYHEDALKPGSYGKVKYVVQPNGGWEAYDYNDQGLISKKFGPWKDGPVNPADATPANCVYEENEYDGNGHVNHVNNYVLGVKVSSQAYIEGSDFEGQSLIVVESKLFHGSSVSNPLVEEVAYAAEWSPFGEVKGKLARVVASDLRAVRYSEEIGTFNPSTAVFVPSGAGSFRRKIATHGMKGDIDGGAFRSKRTVAISDNKGVHWEAEQVNTPSGYETVGLKISNYEDGANGRLVSQWVDGNQVLSITYTGASERVEQDGVGVTLKKTYSSDGKLVKTLKYGLQGGDGVEAQADTTWVHSQLGRYISTTKSSGGLVEVNSSTVDVAGRLGSETDSSGRVHTYSYDSGGLSTTRTAPGGISVTTSYYLDGRVKRIYGSGTIEQLYDYSIDSSANQVETVYYGPAGALSPRWSKTVKNGLRQVISEISAGPNGVSIVVEHEYNNLGQKVATRRTGYEDLRYSYDELGELTLQGRDMDGDGVLELLSSDLITRFDQKFEKDEEGVWWHVNETREYLLNNDADKSRLRVERRKLLAGSNAMTQVTSDGGEVSSFTVEVDRANKKVVSTETKGGRQVEQRVELNGLLVSSAGESSASLVRYRYDALGRLSAQSNPASGTYEEVVYNAAGQVESMDRDGAIVTYEYYDSMHQNAGMIKAQFVTGGGATRFAYDAMGRLAYTWGGGQYPIQYVYSDLGERYQQKTFRATGDWGSDVLPAAFATADASVTTWNYDSASGVLLEKLDSGGGGGILSVL